QNTGLIIDENTGVRSPTLGFYANGLPKSFVQLDRGTGDLLFLTNAGATSALRLSYSTGNATFGGSGSFGATLTVGTNNVNNGYAGVNAILINGYNSGQSILSSNAGSSTNYNGLSIASNYTNSNSLPAWSIDLGGNQNTTTNPDAFTIGRRPSGGSWNSLFTVSNA
ncbi:hypothetical protein ACLUYJ_19520, partial [Acinetobacter baumannii]|uniref:hypothetical protein n=1 Tax=Acinetobacter baumannii TaxID=470 RepID=UPI0039931AC0